MTYPVHWNGDRSCRIAYTLGDVGVSSAGIPASAMPITPKPDDCEKKMVSDRKTFADIMAQRQQDMREREEQAKAWAAEVTEQLANERSSFLQEFTAADRRIFGAHQCKA